MTEQTESFSIFLSSFYANFFVVLGIALPATNAIIGASPRKIDGFYIFMNLISSIFLSYFYVVQLKQKKYGKTSFRTGKVKFGDNVQHIQHGSFYLHLGVAMFGIISIIFYGLQFGQFFELDNRCKDPLMALMPLTRMIFIMQQMMFIITWSQYLKKNEQLALKRFGLMHLIATNLCIWFRVIIEETEFKILNVHQKSDENDTLTNDFYKYSWEYDGEILDCHNSDIMKPLLRNANPYLSPCAVEYSLLCTVILVTMWKNINSNASTKRNIDLTKSRRLQMKHSVIHSEEPLDKFYIDCENAQKGFLVSLVLFLGTVISLIMFFQLIKLADYSEMAIIQVNVWEITLSTISTVMSIILLLVIKRLGNHHSPELYSDHTLLFITQFGVYLYSMFEMIGYYFFIIGQSENYRWLRIAPPMCSIVQSTCQTLLIIEAWKQHCNFEKNIKQKFFRQMITFLIMSNISLWIITRIKNDRTEFHPLQMEFFGVWTWTIIAHVANPMVVCYRFQSTICFYEMWKILNEYSDIKKHKKKRYDAIANTDL